MEYARAFYTLSFSYDAQAHGDADGTTASLYSKNTPDLSSIFLLHSKEKHPNQNYPGLGLNIPAGSVGKKPYQQLRPILKPNRVKT